MHQRAALLAIGLLVGCCVGCVGCGDGGEQHAKPSGFKEIEFESLDNRKVFADFYPSTQLNSEKVVLMFHQAGSNAGEYDSTAASIAALGFNCIAVDQRSGGHMWGRDNRTATKSGEGDYMAAYNDLVGALNYAHSSNYTTIVAWGSSYSASLVFRLAGENNDIKAVVSFSPGEYMDEKGIVKTWASKVSAPVFFACTTDELHDGRQEIYDSIPSDNKVLAVFDGGIHGSSTLLQEKSPAAGKYMDKVKSFLKDLKDK